MQPSKEVGEWLEVLAKPPEKDWETEKCWGGFASAEQGRVPGAALLIPISCQWSRLLKLLGTRVHPALLGTEQEHRVRESCLRPVLPPKHSQMVWSRMPEPPIILHFFSFSLCHNPLMN